ncbi:MAG: NAD(P)/FAD-dependent oxidoreductase [bacterium]|nr:NAD(P)/FAD-dependent oxidoreductase [bacterium]
MFRTLTNGWVPCNILIGPDSVVLFSEGEFDEAGYSAAIAKLYPESAAVETATEPGKESGGRTARSDVANIVILGGGAGGLVAAHDLRRRLPEKHCIVVIDRAADHQFSSSLLWLMAGQRRAEQIHRPLKRLAAQGIEYHQDEVEAIDVGGRLVRTRSEQFDFDYLIVALGAQLAPETIEGFDKMAHNLYDLNGCEQIRAALETFEGGKIGVLVTSMPFKCPAAPYEAAFLVDTVCRKRGVRAKTEIHLFTPEHQPMPVAGPRLGDAIAEMLRAREIDFHPLYTFQELWPETKEIVSSDGADEVDLLIAVPPHQVPEVVRAAGLVGVSGWIHVDKKTLRTEHDGVFAIGDVTSIRLPNGKMLPKAGVFAHSQAKVVAEQIVAEIRGRPSDASFDGKGYCWIELGNGRAGFASGRFYAEPDPQVRMFWPGRFWHWGKVAFEKWWLRHFF